MTWPEAIRLLERGESPDGLPINPARGRLPNTSFTDQFGVRQPNAKGPVRFGWYSYRRLKPGSLGGADWVTEWFRVFRRRRL